MKLLAVDTSTTQASIVLAENGQILHEQINNNPKSHGEFLNAAIQSGLQNLNWQFRDLNALATSLGPGSFTGARVSVAAIKALAYSLQLKIYATDTLSLIYYARTKLSAEGPVVVANNAYKKMLYVSAWINSQNPTRPTMTTTTAPTAMTLKDFEQLILSQNQPVSVLGDGIQSYKGFISDPVMRQIHEIALPIDTSLAKTLAHQFFSAPETLSTFDWKSITPLYLRASEAEENLRSKFE